MTDVLEMLRRSKCDPAADVQLRWMIGRDADRVLEIDALSFASKLSAADLRYFQREASHVSTVAEDRVSDAVVGHMVYAVRPDALLLVTLAVHPAWREAGVGRRLVTRLADRCGDHRKDYAVAFASDRDTTAHLFMRACGFRAVRVLPRGAAGADDVYEFRRYADRCDGK